MNILIEKRLFRGPCAIVITPLREDGKVDFDGLCLQIDSLCATNVQGVVVCGSTGEFSQLSLEQNQEIMRQSAAVTKGRKPLVCGATTGDYRSTVAQLEYIAGLGADGSLVAPPYYLPLDDDDVIEFYGALSRARTGAPIALYHIPQFTSPISLKAFEQIIEMDGIHGIKNSSGDMNLHMQLLHARDRKRTDFSILTGSDESIFASLSVGGDGSFTALCFLLPHIIGYIYDQYEADRAEALRCQMDLLPLLRLASGFTFPLGYKALAEVLGSPNRAYGHAISDTTARKLSDAKKNMESMVLYIYEKYGIRRT